jgi:spore maturation protein CgeB
VRVGVIGPTGRDRFAENISEALCRTGHAVTRLGPAHIRARGRLAGATTLARQLWNGLDDAVQARVARAALEAECEVVINVDQTLTPKAVARIKRGGIKVAFWFPDHVANMGRQLMLLSNYDAVFFKEPYLVERLRATIELPVYYLPQACNPHWHRPLVPVGTEPYLVIAGNMYPSRVRLLERVMAKGIPLQLYGAGFPRWLGETPARSAYQGRAIVREDKARVFRAAAGVLNTMHPAEMAGVNVRLFEAAGCGAAVLTEFRSTIPDLFAVGDEVLTFRDFDELVSQAARLLNEAGLSARLGDAAAKRAHRDHTYDVRVGTILEKAS